MSDHEKLAYPLVDLGYYNIPEHLLNYEAVERNYDLGTNEDFVERYFWGLF